MGKPPRSRHSRTRKDPVTIDLEASEVERIRDDASPAEQAAAAQAEGDPGVADQTADIAPEPSSLDERADAGVAPGDEAASTSGDDATSTDAPDAPGAATESAPQEPVQEPWRQAAPDESPSYPTTPPPAAAAGSTRSRGRTGAFVAGAAGGLVVVALAAVLQWAGLLPSPAPGADPAAAELRAEVEELRQALAAQPAGAAPEELARLQEALDAAEAEIAALAGRLDEQPAGVADLEPRLAALEASIAGAGEDAPAEGLVAGIEERVAGIEAAIAALSDQAAPDAAPQEAVAALENRLAELEAAIASVGQEAAPDSELEAVDARLAALEEALAGQGETAGRIAALEAALQSLSEQAESLAASQQEQSEGPQAALVIAASALRAAIERGDAFTVELDTFAALAPQTEGLDELRPAAGTGVATRAELLSELPAAADRMVAAGRPQAESGGFIDSLWQSAQDLVSVRPIGAVEGDSVEATVARIEVAIEAGDLDTALAEYRSLPEAAREAGRDYMQRVETRRLADVVTERALAAALRPA